MEAIDLVGLSQITRWDQLNTQQQQQQRPKPQQSEPDETNQSVISENSNDDKSRKPAADLETSNLITIQFSQNRNLNSRIALWHGDPLHLPVDALTHPTTERFERRDPFTDRLYHRAGPRMLRTLFRRVTHCPIGGVKVTPGYDSLARVVIHTATPRYERRYRTAAENMLYNCYRNTLLAAMRHRARTVALVPLAIVAHHFPAPEAAHLAIRVVRRFLEHYPNAFDLIIFVTGSASANADATYRRYAQILPLYFPRSAEEERLQCAMFAASLDGRNSLAEFSGPLGEPLRPERGIRIKADPIGAALESLSASSSAISSSSSSSPSPSFSPSPSSCSSSRSSSMSSANDSLGSSDGNGATKLVCSIGRSKFARMNTRCRDEKYFDSSSKTSSSSKKHNHHEHDADHHHHHHRRHSRTTTFLTQMSKYTNITSSSSSSSSSSRNHNHHHRHQDHELARKFERQFRYDRLRRKVAITFSVADRRELREKIDHCVQMRSIDADEESSTTIVTVRAEHFETSSMCNDYTALHLLDRMRSFVKSNHNHNYHHNHHRIVVMVLMNGVRMSTTTADTTVLSQLIKFIDTITDLLPLAVPNATCSMQICQPSIWHRLALRWWLHSAVTFSAPFKDMVTFAARPNIDEVA